MLIVATLAMLCACMLTNPPSFSQTHMQDNSLLKTVVSYLALAGADGESSAFPTLRIVEIRRFCFHIGAAALMLVFGAQLIMSRSRPTLTRDDLFDLKRHMTAPYVYWGLLLFISVISSYFSHAPNVSMGGVLLRLFTFGWWLPLAFALRPADARKLTISMVAVITLMTLFGIWYFHGRADGRNRLWYPVGNELWFAACLLPAIFAAAGGILAGLQKRQSSDGSSGQRIDLIVMSFVAMAICGYALWMTKSRSAGAGMYAGACFALILLAPRKRRMFVLLGSILVAIAVVQFVVMPLLRESSMGDRAHSVRSRLNHEWPYALTLWMSKIVGGNGEGGYTMLAGQFARDDQLLDPNAIAIDEHVWVVEAHNEYLQLLADVGIAGTIGFVGALIVTLFWAIRYVDRRRENPKEAVNRSVVIGLAAAIVAVAFEEGATVGLRQPGLPPLFFTAWACLWAMVRDERPIPQRNAAPEEIEARRLKPSSVRLAGVVSALVAIALGFVGFQNWRASRAQHDAVKAIQAGDFETAITQADMSGRKSLDPMRKLISRKYAIEARILELRRRTQRAVETETPPNDRDIELARLAQIEINDLNSVAPRFLGISTLRWELALTRCDIHRMRNERAEAIEFRIEFLRQLENCRLDEPFNFEYLVRLWAGWNELPYFISSSGMSNSDVVQFLNDLARPSPADRVNWLRMYLRRNDVDADPRFRMLVQELATHFPGFQSMMEGAVNIAKADAEKPYAEWTDPLSPETLRISALYSDMIGQHARAAKDAGLAADMYAKSGGPLFTAHSAALYEQVNDQFRDDPTRDPAPLLERLVKASEILYGPLPRTDGSATSINLDFHLGATRLLILLATGREAEAKSQIEHLSPNSNEPIDTRLANAYASLANQFAFRSEIGSKVNAWIQRADALVPDLLFAKYAKLRLSLARGDDNAAFETATTIIDASADRNEGFAALAQAEMERPESGVWSALRRKYDDYPPLPETPSTQPAAPTRRVPDISELPNEAAAAETVGSAAP